MHGRWPNPGGALRCLLVVCCLAALGCAPQFANPYRTYRAAHPDWTPGELEAGMPAGEALATAFSSRKGIRQSMKVRAVYHLVGDTWVGVAPPGEPIAQPAGESLVVARIRCRQSVYRPSEARGADAPGPTAARHEPEQAIDVGLDATGWYHFKDGQLHSFVHWKFRAGCAGEAVAPGWGDCGPLRSPVGRGALGQLRASRSH